MRPAGQSCSRGSRSLGRLAAVAAIVAACTACGDRGCARRELERERAAAAVVSALDCPPGLLQCLDGVVLASTAAQIEQPCRGREATCACPWSRVHECASPCVADALVVVADPEAAPQLCSRPSDGSAFVAAHRDGGIGLEARAQTFQCHAAIVRACDDDGDCRDVARCVRGCAAAVGDVPAIVSVDVAAPILCARGDARVAP